MDYIPKIPAFNNPFIAIKWTPFILTKPPFCNTNITKV